MKDADYFAHQAVSQSNLKEILRSPAHYLERIKNPMAPTPQMTLGSAIHCAILEPHDFASRYVACSMDRRTKFFKEFEATHKDKTILTEDECLSALKASEFVSNHEDAQKLLKGSTIEAPMFWVDPLTKIECKAKIDAINHDLKYIVDVKSTKDAGPVSFMQSIKQYRYDFQAAWYLRQFKNYKFFFIAVEKEPPYGIACYELDPAWIEVGDNDANTALQLLKACQEDGKYPSYHSGIKLIEKPRWL